MSPNGSFTAPADPIVLNFSQQVFDDESPGAEPTTVDFGAGCPSTATQASNCSTPLGSASLSCATGPGYDLCTATYTIPAPFAPLPDGIYAIVGFTNLAKSPSIIHTVRSTSAPVASEVVLPTPASTQFGMPVELQPTVDPFPLTGTVGAMGTFEVFNVSNASLGTAYATPTGFDGRGTVAAPGFGLALDVGTTQVYAKYHSPGGNFPTLDGGPSATVGAVVTAADTQVAVGSTPFNPGSPVTLTATLSANVTAAGLPAGLTFSGTATNAATVTFYADSTPIGTGTLIPPGSDATAAPQFTLTTSALGDGSHDITATYSGNTRFKTSTSNTLTIVPGATSDTSATLTSSKSPAAYGEAVTFTAKVTTTTGSPTGTVTFRDTTNGTTDLGTVVVTATPGSGTAAFTTSTLQPGARSIVAIYNGDAGHPGGAIATLTQTVNKAVATISFTSSSPVSVYGQTIALSVNVAAPTSLTGTLKIYDGTILVATTVGSSASATPSVLPVGTHQLRAVYSNDPNVADQAADLTQVVTQASARVALTASSDASSANVNVTFGATVSVMSPGAATPTGEITFVDGTTPLGTAVIGAGGVATFSTRTLSSGNHTITASYAGDVHLTAATASIDHRVASGIVSLDVTASPAQATFGAPVTLKAKPDGAVGVPGGTVAFHVGSTQLGTVGFDGSGSATLVTTKLPVGASTITADYSGDSSYPSSSGTVTVAITAGDTTTTLASSANPATTGSTVTFTATVTGQGAQPTGSVVFFDGTVAIGTGTLANGTATLALGSLTAGDHSIVATYQGSDSYSASHSPALVETIGGATNGPPASTPTADAGAPTTGTTTPVTTSSSDDGGCSEAPSRPTGSLALVVGTVLALSTIRRRKRAA